LIEQAKIVRRRYLSSSNGSSSSHGQVLHDKEDSEDQEWCPQRIEFDTPENRRIKPSDGIRHSRGGGDCGFKGRTSRFKSSSSTSRERISVNLKFSNSNNDIDIRNDPEYEFENVFNDNLGSDREVDLASCEKVYGMVKEIKTLKEDLKIADFEIDSLRWKFEDADNKIIDLEEKLVVKNDVLKHFEDELASSRRKTEADGVLIKDLEFENRNKRKLIEELEEKNEVLMETHKKLKDENSLIRRLAKEISDDSDNLLGVISELKAEKIVTDERMKYLLQSNRRVDQEQDDNEEGSKDIASQEEVNESLDNCEDDAKEPNNCD